MDPEIGVELSVFPEASGNGNTFTSATELKNDAPQKRRGSVMTFHDVSYTVSIEKICCGSCRSTEPKAILHEMSGILRPGLNAIMGSTGSGKSTLLDVLANRKDPACVSGKVFLDGKPVPKNFQYLSGYVVQNDLFVATVTVREALWFCANLRLPSSVSHADKADKIEKIMKDLGLLKCSDTKIGNDLIRGISGGEKKRTSIAAELILEPRILFLDEPTTGLDAATARSVVSLLQKLGDQGHTVVCSIHQPRYSIYKMFDRLILLSNGHMVYQGPACRTLDYFAELGYVCEAHDNPADFYLDVLNGAYESTNEQPALNESSDSIIDPTNLLKESFCNSGIKKELDSELHKMSENEALTSKNSASKKMYANGFWRQMKILLGRTGINMIRNPQMLLGNTIITFIIGVVFGLIYLQASDTPDGVQNRLGILFFLCTNLLFGSSLVIGNFVKEREIFVHEHVSGYYSVSSYFLSKVVADLIPLRTLPPVVYTLITYWMVGLKAEAGSVFIFLLTAVLLGYASVGIGILYSATFSESIAQLVMILTFVFTIVFSGLLVNLREMGDWLSWLQYFSVCRYGIVAFSIAEFKGTNFTQCGNISDGISSAGPFGSAANNEKVVTTNISDTVCTVLNGEVFLKGTLAVGGPGESIDDWDLWQNILALGCITVGLYTLTYIQLVRKKRYS